MDRSLRGAAGALLLSGALAVAAAADTVKVGKQFPAISGTDVMTGKRFSLDSLRGKVVIVKFWATW
ncbi:MAG: hypothetical protein U1D55_10210 [Phycisphaerae bacterium]